MNPISRLRTRARSHGFRSETCRPLSEYTPSDGESSRPRIDSSVDLPQPDGPEIATYSPRPISTSIFANAWVSTSSVTKTLVTPWDLKTAGIYVCIDVSSNDVVIECGYRVSCHNSLESYPIDGVPVR